MAELTSVITLLFLVFLFPLGVQLWKLTLCRSPSSPLSSNVYLLLLWTVCLSVCIAQNGTAGDDRFRAVEMGSDGSSVLAGNVNGWFCQYTGSILKVYVSRPEECHRRGDATISFSGCWLLAEGALNPTLTDSGW